MSLADYSLTIGGKAVMTADRLDVINPATGAVIGRAPHATREHLDEAVAAARRAFPVWRDLPRTERERCLKAAAAVLVEHADALMRLLTSEQGKPHEEAMVEIMGAAHWLTAFAGMEIPVKVNEDGPERLSETRRVPVGVVAGISPWNFPVLLSFWKIAPALAAGNALVLKPSPFTPLTMLRIGELLRGIFPPGVLNIINGDDALGPRMTAHPGFDKISFTGSTATGKRVMASAATDLKRVTLELGGNDAAIVLPDVDIEQTAKALFWAAFRNSGQICIAAKRLYVHADIYEPLTRALVDYARGVRLGNGAEQETQLGPVQNAMQFARVAELIDDSKAEGHDFLLGGEIDRDQPGYFIPVTIIGNPPETSRIVQEEPFGPVLPILKFDDLEDAIARANASDYGLAGSVWTKDIALAGEIARRLETGTVWINEVQHVTPFQPFAGHKQSGIGVENGLSGLLEYTVAQTVTVKHLAA